MWFFLALSSTLFSAIGTILNKHCLKTVSAAVLTWSLFALPIPLIAYIALKDGMPALNQMFFVGVTGSALLFVVSKTIANEAFKNNAISQIFPLTSLGVLFIYLFGLLFLSESLRPVPMAGMMLIVCGSYILNADKAKENIFKPFRLLLTNKASRLFLLAILLTSMATIFDRIGITNTNPTNPAFALLWENIIMVPLLTIYLLKQERNTWRSELKENFGFLLLATMIYTVTTLLVFNAFIDGPVALVTGIARLQVFFVLLLSYIFLRDKPTKYAWIASGIMGIGVIMIKLG